MMELWNLVQNAIKTVGIAQFNLVPTDEDARAGEKYVLMHVSGE